MKKLVILTLCFFMSICVLSHILNFADEVTTNSSEFEVKVLSSNDQSILIEYNIGKFERIPVNINGETYYHISLLNEGIIFKHGDPALPKITRSIIIPDNAGAEVKVTESEFIEYQMQIAPSKGLLDCNTNPDNIPYEFSETYNINAFFPDILAEPGSPYILRDFRGITVTVYPFLYNPVSGVLRVYTHLVVEINYTGENTENVKTRNCEQHNIHFSNIYKHHFLNYSYKLYDSVDEHGRLIVICFGDFLETIQPYVNWKNQKGIQTDVYDIISIGTDTTAIKNFIQAEYNSAEGLTFVQFVGDAEQIPTLLITRDFAPGKATSDPSYALLEGNDSYPDIFVGRFSASTVAEVETQVERTIYYEKDIIDGSWLHKGTGVGSIWGDGYGYLGLSDKDLIEVLRIKLLGYTYTEVDQLYEEESGSIVIPVEVEEFVEVINEGRSIVNIAGHGDYDATFMIPPGSLNDLFTTDSIYDLMNDYMLPFISIGAPYQGNFQIDISFAEAWLRATNTNTGAPVGAIAVHSSSTDLDYASPGATQHEMVDLLVNEENNTIGGLMFNGGCFAIDIYGARGEKTFKSFNIFGDASLQVRTDIPETLTVSSDSVIYVGHTQFTVSTGVEAVLVCLSENYEIIASGYTDTDGNITLEFSPFQQPTTSILTVTGHNKITGIDTIPVINPAIIPERFFGQGILNFPNPFSEKTIFYFDIPKNQKASLEIFSPDGQMVEKFDITNKEKVEWNPDNLHSGIYLVRIVSANYLKTKKIVYRR